MARAMAKNGPATFNSNRCWQAAKTTTCPSPSCRQDVQQTQLHMPMLRNFAKQNVPPNYVFTLPASLSAPLVSADNKLNCLAKQPVAEPVTCSQKTAELLAFSKVLQRQQFSFNWNKKRFYFWLAEGFIITSQDCSNTFYTVFNSILCTSMARLFLLRTL